MHDSATCNRIWYMRGHNLLSKAMIARFAILGLGPASVAVHIRHERFLSYSLWLISFIWLKKFSTVAVKPLGSQNITLFSPIKILCMKLWTFECCSMQIKGHHPLNLECSHVYNILKWWWQDLVCSRGVHLVLAFVTRINILWYTKSALFVQFRLITGHGII